MIKDNFVKAFMDINPNEHLLGVSRNGEDDIDVQACYVQERIAELAATNERLREVVKRALEPGVFGIQDRSMISAPEDEKVRKLGGDIGFGALMDSASRMWAIWAKENGYEGSHFVTGPCAATQKRWVEEAQQALEGE